MQFSCHFNTMFAHIIFNEIRFGDNDDQLITLLTFLTNFELTYFYELTNRHVKKLSNGFNGLTFGNIKFFKISQNTVMLNRL